MTREDLLNQAEADCERITSYIPSFSQKSEKLFRQANEEIDRIEYSVGGTIHRGHYCPSPVLDLIVSGQKRGRLKKTAGDNAKTHIFGFDRDNKLLFVCSPWNSKEVISYKDNIEYGFSCNWGPSCHPVDQVSECIYVDNFIQSYTLYTVFNDSVLDFKRELYTYENGRLGAVMLQQYLSKKWAVSAIAKMGLPAITTGIMNIHSKYVFEHDSEGNLSQYFVVRYRNTNLLEPMPPEGPFPIKQKRKV